MDYIFPCEWLLWDILEWQFQLLDMPHEISLATGNNQLF